MRRILVIGIAGCLALVLSSPGIGQTPKDCGIRRVERSETGLDVYFTAPQTVNIVDRTRHARLVMIMPDMRLGASGTGAAYTVRAASAAMGERLGSHNTPEDSCLMRVVTRDGRIGIDAEASFNMPGGLPQSKTVFIPAEQHSPSGQASTRGYICWIDHLEETETGVNVYFGASRQVNISNDEHQSRMVWTDPAAPVESSGSKGAAPASAASAVSGETLSLSSEPEDKCVMKVVSRAGRLGVETADWFMAAE